MATESFLATCLPRSADAAERVHLSIFITHRLMPDGGSGKLADFPNVVDWTNRLAKAEIELTGRAGGGASFTIPATPLLDLLEPQLWPRVFPPDLLVRPWKTPDMTGVPYSFSDWGVSNEFRAMVRRTLYQICAYSKFGLALLRQVA